MDPLVWMKHQLRDLRIPKPGHRPGWVPHKLAAKRHKADMLAEAARMAEYDLDGVDIYYPTYIVPVPQVYTIGATSVNIWPGDTMIWPITGGTVRVEAINAWNTWSGVTTASLSSVTWNMWAAGPALPSAYDRPGIPLPPLTEEQLRAHRDLVAAQVIANKAADEKRILAQGRAEDLLRRCLSGDQFKQWERGKYVVVPKGDRRYVLDGDGARVLNDKNQLLESICIHVREYGLPTADKLLAQLLMLEHSEMEFLRIGNRSAAWPSPPHVYTPPGGW